ncbi:MAG: WxcM-like domain-containing protein [Candidatus Altiarchaeota archaeon]|nr:WxcM-like domain-containing protein [Candidatus Altiarchaeota archaeon]
MLGEKLIREKHVREDGWLVELVSKAYADEPHDFIHSYLVNIEPEHSRAGHFHRKKKEWLCLASGRIELTLEDVGCRMREKIVMDSESDEYAVYLIPPGVAHLVKNPSRQKSASLVVFSDGLEDPSDTFIYRFE